MTPGIMGLGLLLFFALIVIAKGIAVLNEFERGVLLRLGRYVTVRGPGIIFIIPFVERIIRVDLRVQARDVPPQDVITRDNVTVKVNAVLYYRIVSPDKAVLEVENVIYATNQLAQTTLRSVLGEVELDDLLSQREEINLRLQSILDKQTDPWGVKVSAVEVKHIDLPAEMQRAMAKQAEAERERRAKIIAADGEHQAAGKLSEAAHVISDNPLGIQLRYLQTLIEVAGTQSNTIVFPVPMDLLQPKTTFVRHEKEAPGANDPDQVDLPAPDSTGV